MSVAEDKDEEVKVENSDPVLEDDEVDLREYHPAGGPVVIQSLHSGLSKLDYESRS